MQNKLFNKWLPIFILIQPLFDVITSFMTSIGINVTVGIIVKMLILFLMGIYLVFIDKYKRKYNFIYLGIIIIFCLGNVYFNIDILKSHFSEYAGYLMKYVYFTVTIFYFIKWYKNGNYIKLNELRLPFIIISITFILSWITGTAFDTYLPDSGKYGSSGWFFSGNEIGALLSIIFPIVLYNSLHNPNSHKWEIILTVIIGIALLSLGTKVGLLGYFITIVGYLIYRLIAIIKIKLDKKFVFVLACLIIPMLFWSHIPAVYNTSIRYDSLEIDSEEITEEERAERINFLIYSGRNGYIARMVMLRKDISVGERIFGKFYEREDKTLFITEQDPFDIYFLFGILGTIIMFIPLLYVIFSSLKTWFKEIKTRFFDIESAMCLLSIVLALGVATMSGHTLLAPSVSTFMIIILIAFYIKCHQPFEEENKEKMLIGSVHMEVGGIEKTLINLLKKINYKKYDVDLMLLKPEGKFLNELPENINIITPYDSQITRKMVLSNNVICKMLKHLMFNYYTASWFTTNKKYNVAISYSGYYPFVDNYIGYSEAEKKLIWVHTDVEYNYNHFEKYKKKFDRTKYKYERFDTIVGVSEGVKKSFDKILPEYKDKTTFLWNIIDFKNQDETTDIKLEGKFKIVSIGRLCTQKRFDKIIDAAKQLPEDIKIYIIGNGELYSALDLLIKTNQLNEKVILLGEQLNIRSILKQADLFLSTSDFEGLPTVLLESLLCGIPIVATDVCGNSDIFKYIAPKGSMILCKNNVSSIVKIINKVCNNSKTVNKKFKFDLNSYNLKNMEKFYKLIGE